MPGGRGPPFVHSLLGHALAYTERFGVAGHDRCQLPLSWRGNSSFDHSTRVSGSVNAPNCEMEGARRVY